MTASLHEASYAEASGRMNRAGSLGALMITAVLLVEVWGDWSAVAAIGAVQAVLMAFNTWVNLVLIRRGVKRAETIRTVVNSIGTVIMAVGAGFPLAIWLWIPFVALTFDHVNQRIAVAMVVSFTAIVDVLAIVEHVPWILPVIFDTFAVICVMIARARSATIRDMLLRSDAQRQQLADANRELAAAHQQLVEEVKVREQVELELRQAQKLEAIGRLASGLAHEINTPVQFVSDSVHFVDDATRDLLALAGRAHGVIETMRQGAPVHEALAAIALAEQEADLPYLVEHVPVAIGRVLDGLERITTIVRSMKEFAHPDLQHLVAADLNRALLATITIAAPEYRLVADVDFDPGELPRVTCRPGEINQVFLNLIVNAAHAIADVVHDSGRRGRIAVATRVDGGDAVITIADTGAGIPAEIRDRIFDPFFTTKEVGRGTGQGLAIARNVIRHHGGALTFESAVGRGTIFTIRLPTTAVDPTALARPRRSTEMAAVRVAAR